jgi:FAD/FMN-containing dehydrogenase
MVRRHIERTNRILGPQLTCAAIILYNDKEHSLAEDLVHRMVKRAIEMEGTATGEHGVGMVKRDYLEHEVGRSTVDLMRKVSLQLGTDGAFRQTIAVVLAP